MNPFDLLRGQTVSASQLRQEIYLLGGRHRGDALAGALLELKEQGLTTERRALLRAVVSHLGRGKSAAQLGGGGGSPRVVGGDFVYMAVIAGSAAWVLVVMYSLAS